MSNKQPVSYLQIDARWKYADYSARGEKTTVGASGCGPTAMAMVLAEWADPKVTPLTECRWALAHGFKAPKSGTYHSYFVPAARPLCSALGRGSGKGYRLCKRPRLHPGKADAGQLEAFQNASQVLLAHPEACVRCAGHRKGGHYVC